MDLKRVMVIVGFQTGKRKTNRRYAVMDGTCGRERREAAGLGFSRVVSRGIRMPQSVPDVSGRCVSHPPTIRNRKLA